MKNTRTRRVVAAAGAFAISAALGLAAVATATPSTGTVTPVIIGAGSMSKGMGFNAHPGTNTVVAEFTFGPHSSTGWHTHPGKTLVTVQSGQPEAPMETVTESWRPFQASGCDSMLRRRRSAASWLAR